MLPPTKSCPRLWGKWHEVPKGVRLKTAECRELFPLSFAYAQQNAGWNMVVLQRCRLQYSLFRPILPSLHRPLGALGSNPPHAVEPLGAVQTRRTVPYPFAERSFQWGYGGVQGGLRGEIEIFPGPPAKRLYSNSQLFVYINPSDNPPYGRKRAYIPYSPFSTVRVLE